MPQLRHITSAEVLDVDGSRERGMIYVQVFKNKAEHTKEWLRLTRSEFEKLSDGGIYW